jgi:hypothetical protein
MRYFVLFVIALFFIKPAFAEHNEDQQFICDSPQIAKEKFNNGSLEEEPNYLADTAARVQKEHPNTHIFGQVKFIISDKQNTNFAICQYSNHVGLVFQVYYRDAKINNQPYCTTGKCLSSSHWRSEWIEGNSKLDRPQQTHLDVCIIERDSVAYPSIECSFTIEHNDNIE